MGVKNIIFKMKSEFQNMLPIRRMSFLRYFFCCKRKYKMIVNKANTNVNDAFFAIARIIKAGLKTSGDGGGAGVKLGPPPKAKSGTSCC